MTTSNAMHERQSYDEMAAMRSRIADLERADEYNRKAINHLLKTLEEKRETERSKRVEDEREEIAKLVERYHEYQFGNLEAVLAGLAAVIRARGK